MAFNNYGIKLKGKGGVFVKKNMFLLGVVFFIIFSFSPVASAVVDVNDPKYDPSPTYSTYQAIEQAKIMADAIRQYRQANPIQTTLPAGARTLKARIYDLRTVVFLYNSGGLSGMEFSNRIEAIKYPPSSTLTANGNYFQTIANLLQGGYITHGQALNELQKLELIMIIENLNK